MNDEDRPSEGSPYGIKNWCLHALMYNKWSSSFEICVLALKSSSASNTLYRLHLTSKVDMSSLEYPMHAMIHLRQHNPIATKRFIRPKLGVSTSCAFVVPRDLNARNNVKNVSMLQAGMIGVQHKRFPWTS